MKLKGTFFLLAICTMPGLVKSQSQNPNPTVQVARMQFQSKQVVPPAPEAAELGKYGNVPVSLFTGTPNISIPLAELKGNTLSVPISLSYNASGYKPTDVSTWVGSGWSLNAGGVVTRSVIGNPDKETNYFGVSNVLNPPNSADIFPAYTYMQNIQAGIIETQPDIYYYNFNGHSGKFILRPDMSVAKKEKDLAIITPCFTGGCGDSKFTIVDDQGITYVFDKVETTRLVPRDDENVASTTVYHFVSSWYLSLIYAPNTGDIVEFEYYSSDEEHVLTPTTIPNKSYTFTYGCRKSLECGAELVQEGGESVINPPYTYIKRKFLKRINFKKYGTIVQYADLLSATGQRQDSDYPDDRRLNQVKIYSVTNGTDKLVKQYDLSYGYFDAGVYPNEYQGKRLRLDAVQEIATDINTTSPPAHTFTYDLTCASRFTAGIDHWGFYNGAANPLGLVPYASFPGISLGCGGISPFNIAAGANREASAANVEATLLKKITYPTGGYTTFEYELNKAKEQNGGIVTHDVGGARISRIIDYSFTNKKALVKTYSYLKDDGSTSGLIGAFPTYSSESYFHHYPRSGNCAENFEYDLTTISVSANSVYSLGTYKGSHIGYSQVTETITELDTYQPLGKTVYNYSIGNYMEHEEDIRSGDLVKKTVYRNDGKLLEESAFVYSYTDYYDITGQIVKSAQYQTNKGFYCKVGTNNYINYGWWQNPDPSCTMGTMAVPTHLYLENYPFNIQTRKLTQETVKIYDQVNNNYLTTTKDYTYGSANHYSPTLITETTTNGEKVNTALKYTGDYTASTTSGTMAANIKDMQDLNMKAVLVEKLLYRSDASGNNKQYLSGQLTDHVGGRPVNIYYLETQPPLSSVTLSSITPGVPMQYNSNYRLGASMQFSSGNLSSQSKTDDVQVSYLWDYEESYPIAEITGASVDDTRYTSFETANKGGFSFTGTITAGTAVTGKRYYSLTSGSISSGANVTKTYILSYWRDSNAGPYTVTGSTGYKQGATKGSWTYYQHTVSSTTTVSISGTGLIDELRFYPETAQMKTQSFEPLVGITSQCGVNSQLLYYEYDGLNRLVNIKDDNGHILKNFTYNYGLGTAPATSSQTLFYSAGQETSFTKVCTAPGSVGTAVVYKVPYGKYVSSLNQTDANNKAIAEVTANGQANANANGECRFYNQERWQWYFSHNCPSGTTPIGIKVYAYAGSFYSLISVADANAIADAWITANGQNIANQQNQCQ